MIINGEIIKGWCQEWKVIFEPFLKAYNTLKKSVDVATLFQLLDNALIKKDDKLEVELK